MITEEDKDKLIATLTLQLQEKDIDLSLARNEINTLKHNLNISQEHDNVMCEQYFNKCKEIHQNKISFAVEQLEKVLKMLEEKQFYKKEDTAYCVHPAQIAEYIEDQIKNIKRGEMV